MSTPSSSSGGPIIGESYEQNVENARRMAAEGDSQIESGSEPKRIVERLRESLPKGTTIPKMHKGGVVKATGPVILKRGEQVIPAPEDQTQDPQAAAQQTAPDDSNMSDEGSTSGEPIKLQRLYSKLNESLITLMDGLGLRRSFTVPYAEQPSDQHVAAVGLAAQQSGGLAKHLILSAHHSGGKGWGSSEGHSVGFSADKLRTTIIPKNSEEAKAAITAASSYLNGIEKLVGEDDPAVKTAKSQLALVQKTSGQSMTAADFGVMLIQICHGPTQSVSRAYSNSHKDGMAIHIRAPQVR